MILRDYQQRSLDELYHWWENNPLVNDIPVCVLPTAAGKSVIIAELARLLFDTYPESHPRTVVIVPSKELAEQNAAKLRARLPAHITVGYYSASLGQKNATADVIVATIGSIYKDAFLLGAISCVVVDECHLASTSGAEAGRYRKFLTDLSKLCQYRVVGYTATPFRGDGVWITDGAHPLFTGIACTVKIKELMEAKYLSPLVIPPERINTKIDTHDIKTTSGDYNLHDLANRVTEYLPAVVAEACKLAANRKKWIAFTATVENAQELVSLLEAQGIRAVLVCGATPKTERENSITQFRAGRIRCLVTVLALAIGFDVPDVDCIIWCRPTISPVLYVQGAGRGMRIAPDKDDCLWLDFSDTTERMGPVDTIKGRKKRASKKDEDAGAPTKVCDECGERNPISARECIHCGTEFVFESDTKVAREASRAAILEIARQRKINTYQVTEVRYRVHRKQDKPDSLRVDYYNGIRRVGSEWLCFDHGGFAAEKARLWVQRRAKIEIRERFSTASACNAFVSQDVLHKPQAITIDETGSFPNITNYQF